MVGFARPARSLDGMNAALRPPTPAPLQPSLAPPAPWPAPLQPSPCATGRGPERLRYREIAPPPHLAHAIACFWTIESDGALAEPFSYLAVPDACVDLVFDLGAAGDAIVYGARDTAFVERLAGTVSLFGVRVRPGRTGALLAQPGGALAEATLPLDDVVAGASDWHDEIACARDARERAAAAARRLSERRPTGIVAESTAPSLELIDAILGGDGRVRVDELARRAALSARHLRRLVREATGLSPKRLARIARFQRSLRALACADPPSLAAIAADAGYADQAHMSHEFRALAGRSPGGWRRDRMSDFDKTTARHST